MTLRKLAGYAILVLFGVLVFCTIANDVGWVRALTVSGSVVGSVSAIFLAVWLITE